MAKTRRRSAAENRKRREEYSMAKRVDQLREFEEFETLILPQLRDQIKKGLSAEEIYKHFQHFAAARAITIAMTEADSSKALAAIKDVLDRTQGRAKERKEVEHTFSKLGEQELDSFILSQVKELSDDDDSSDTLQ